MRNAATYNRNVARHLASGAGTPRRPGMRMPVLVFALFNENQKPGPTSERNYGVFYPNQQKVYDVEFVLGAGGGRHGSPGVAGGRGRAASESASGVEQVDGVPCAAWVRDGRQEVPGARQPSPRAGRRQGDLPLRCT